MRTRRLHLPRARGQWKVEAPGCVVWLQPDGEGGTRVDVEADGDRFAGEPVKLANVHLGPQHLSKFFVQHVCIHVKKGARTA